MQSSNSSSQGVWAGALILWVSCCYLIYVLHIRIQIVYIQRKF